MKGDFFLVAAEQISQNQTSGKLTSLFQKPPSRQMKLFGPFLLVLLPLFFQNLRAGPPTPGVDSDGDGVSDVAEDINGNNEVDDDDSDMDLIPDYLDTDDDGDGIPTVDEGANEDGDLDPTTGGTQDWDSDRIFDYLDTDDDGDGILTELEGYGGIGSPTDDVDTDGLPNYLDVDSDDDLLEDGVEDVNMDGLTQATETSPVNPDSDDDSVPDGVEDIDSSGSPYDDDSDLDLLPNALDPDDDDDGTPTFNEDANRDGDPTNDDTNSNFIPDYLDPLVTTDAYAVPPVDGTPPVLTYVSPRKKATLRKKSVHRGIVVDVETPIRSVIYKSPGSRAKPAKLLGNIWSFKLKKRKLGGGKSVKIEVLATNGVGLSSKVKRKFRLR